MANKIQVKQVELTSEIIADLKLWQDKSSQLAALKLDEATLRTALAVKLGDPTKFEGTEKVALGNGYVLAIDKDQSYNLTNKNGETQALLAAIALIDIGIAQGLVEWKPAMKKAAYNQLLKALVVPDPLAFATQDVLIHDCKMKLAAALTIKPGMPTLEIVPPKKPVEEAK